MTERTTSEEAEQWANQTHCYTCGKKLSRVKYGCPTCGEYSCSEECRKKQIETAMTECRPNYLLDWLGYQLLCWLPHNIACNASTRFGVWCLQRAGNWAYAYDDEGEP